LFEKMVSLILESRSNNESKWWLYMKEKILTRFPLSLSEKPPGAPLSCPVAVAACLIECVFCELVHLIRFYHMCVMRFPHFLAHMSLQFLFSLPDGSEYYTHFSNHKRP
jgi:hypothetical protein